MQRRARSPSFCQTAFLSRYQNAFLKGDFLGFTRKKCEDVLNIVINAEMMKMIMEVEHSMTEHVSPGLEKSELVVLPWTPSFRKIYFKILTFFAFAYLDSKFLRHRVISS